MAEMRVTIDGMYPPGSTLPVSGTLTTTPSGTQNVAVTTPLNGTAVATSTGTASPVTTLTAATTGTGTAVDFSAARSNITMAIIVTGTVTAGSVALDVSQDGTNWVPDGSVTPVTGTNTMLTVSAEAWRYARGRIATNITGGATVTCTIMAGG